MPHTIRLLLIALGLLGCQLAGAADTADTPQLPPWRVLEFEEKAFWATARSRLEIPPPEGDEQTWVFVANSSVPGNSEEVSIRFDPRSGQLLARERLSRGKEDQRIKSFDYGRVHITRERRIPDAGNRAQPDEWSLVSRRDLTYPASAGELVITSPYLLLLLAERLQARGPGVAMEVLVHTDLNFYRARLTTGNGVPVEVDYIVDGEQRTRGTRETTAVALRVRPEGELAEKDDFSLLGLHGEIILLFDRHSGLPLQVRGEAPRVGKAEIDLKSATMRSPPS